MATAPPQTRAAADQEDEPRISMSRLICLAGVERAQGLPVCVLKGAQGSMGPSRPLPSLKAQAHSAHATQGALDCHHDAGSDQDRLQVCVRCCVWD